MDVRHATVGDLPWLRMLYAELVAEQTASHPDQYPMFGGDADLDAFTLGVYRSLPLPSTGVFVAQDDAQIVGFLGGEIMHREVGMPREYGHAHYLYVVPSYRSRGVARALIAMGAAWALKQGVATVECYGLAGDDGWARRGFRPMLTRYFAPLDVLAAGRAPDAPPVVAEPPPPPKRRGRPRKAPRQRINGIDADVGT